MNNKTLGSLDESLGSSYQNVLNGNGDNLTLTLFCTDSGSESSISDMHDFNISVPAEFSWGTKSVSMSISNIYAPNVSQVIEDASGGPGQLPLNPLYAESFRVNTSCYLINVTAYIQPQGDNPDGDDILVRVFNATNNGGVAKPGGTPSIGYLHQQTQELTENVIFVYLTFSFSNLFLNTSKTYDNTFFISFTRLGAITPSNIQWKLYPDPPSGGNDGADEAQVYGGSASWDASPTAIDFDMKVALAPPNATNTPKPTQIGMKINGTPVLDNTFGSGLWSSSERYESATGNLLMNVQSNWTITYDVNWNAVYNKSIEVTPQFFAQKNTNVTWHLNWTNSFPTGFHEEMINMSLPNEWTPLQIFNRTKVPETQYSDWYWTPSSRILTMENLSENSNDWFINMTSPNFVRAITLERNIGGSYSLILNNLFNITDIIRINATIKDGGGSFVAGGKGNLTIYNPAQIANYTDHNPPNATTSVGGLINFADWTIAGSTYSNGTYVIRVVWYNGTHVGLNETEIEIIYPTNLTSYVDSNTYIPNSVLNRIIGDQINITSFYNNTFTPLTGGISTLGAYYRIENASTGLWVDWTTLDFENLGVGFYNNTFDTTNWNDGVYYILLKFNKTGYFTQSDNITIYLQKRPTSFSSFLNGTLLDFISMFSNETINITSYFEDTYHSVGLPNANVNITIMYNNTMYQMQDDGLGNYSWVFDGWEWGEKVTLPYNFTILINGTRWDCLYNQTTITIQILNTLPVIEGYATNQTSSMYRNEAIWLNATITDLEDAYPVLTPYLCIHINGAQWNNISLSSLGGDLFGYTFTIPNADTYLGQLDIRIRANDSDNGWTEISLGTVNVLNNQPVITNELSNQSAMMYRDQTIWANATITDVEDSPPTDLTAFLCIYLVEEVQWNNLSMAVTGNFFEYNFTIPTTDIYLGQIQVRIRAADTDGGWAETFLGTVTVINNQPVITNELTNQTSSMYRDQTIWANATITDVEDSPPTDLTAFLCIYLVEEVQWNNLSMAVTGNFFE
ncbi:MAG TPA: hypothetical protein VMV49_07170, partial [Candidatus Deferrimicrobium sp.]|nr:hypothetical protein [Candidatus Deferrimicrobium sp.]